MAVLLPAGRWQAFALALPEQELHVQDPPGKCLVEVLMGQVQLQVALR